MDRPGIIFETERLYVRPVMEIDKEYYMKLRKETSEIPGAYENQAFMDLEWNNELTSETNMFFSVFLKEENQFVAISSFQGMDSDYIEIGIDVDKHYRNIGIATELVKAMIQTAGRLFSGKELMIRTKEDNAACRRVAEKCGGLLFETKPSPEVTTFEELMKLIEGSDVNGDSSYLFEKNDRVCIYRIKEST